MAAAITTLAGRLAAGEAEQLELIGEFDARQAWAGPGLLSCAHWVSWKTGMSPKAARERVRVARSLPALPVIAGAFGAGRLSFSQVRALTRVADAGNEAGRVELAEFRMRTTTGYDRDGNFVLRLVCSAQDGALVQAALTQVQAELDRQRAAEAAAAEPAAAIELADVPAETPGPHDIGMPGPTAVADPPAPVDVSAETPGPAPARPALRRQRDEPTSRLTAGPASAAQHPHGYRHMPGVDDSEAEPLHATAAVDEQRPDQSAGRDGADS